MKIERIYSYTVNVSEMIDYGQKLGRILSGKEVPSLSGARFDTTVSGRSEGRLSGSVIGTDFLFLRPDGGFDVDIRARIETDDGCRLFLSAGGVGALREGQLIMDLTEYVRLHSSFPQYTWVNTCQFWARGYADLNKGEIFTEGFMSVES